MRIDFQSKYKRERWLLVDLALMVIGAVLVVLAVMGLMYGV